MLRAWLQSRFPQLADLDDIVQVAYVRVLAARARQEIVRPMPFSSRSRAISRSSISGYFYVFANATRLKLQGAQEASFSGFLPRSANWGFTFTRKPVVLTAKWNYRGLQRLTSLASYGPGAFQYWKARTQLDLNLDYQFSRRLAFFAIARNALNGRSVLLATARRRPNTRSNSPARIRRATLRRREGVILKKNHESAEARRNTRRLSARFLIFGASLSLRIGALLDCLKIRLVTLFPRSSVTLADAISP